MALPTMYTLHDQLISLQVANITIPLSEGQSPPGEAAKGSWRAHLNAMQTVVEQELGSALVLEDDLDWDVRIKEQMKDFAKSVRTLTQPLARHSRNTRYDFRVSGLLFQDSIYTKLATDEIRIALSTPTHPSQTQTPPRKDQKSNTTPNPPQPSQNHLPTAITGTSSGSAIVAWASPTLVQQPISTQKAS
jgi:hypothetical protein